MKYIPGYKFTKRNQRPQLAVKTITSLKTPLKKRDGIIPGLQPNVEYEIYKITPKIKDGIATEIVYTFRGRTGTVNVTFKTTTSAEELIDRVLGIGSSRREHRDDVRQKVSHKLSETANKYFNR